MWLLRATSQKIYYIVAKSRFCALGENSRAINSLLFTSAELPVLAVPGQRTPTLDCSYPAQVCLTLQSEEAFSANSTSNLLEEMEECGRSLGGGNNTQLINARLAPANTMQIQIWLAWLDEMDWCHYTMFAFLFSRAFYGLFTRWNPRDKKRRATPSGVPCSMSVILPLISTLRPSHQHLNTLLPNSFVTFIFMTWLPLPLHLRAVHLKPLPSPNSFIPLHHPKQP